ncbi:MAG: Gfo/Idh/MocA family oxidoreductase [Phycisphaerae bacterium]|nr:Gfo/Idh/MocA family oxidoreductase [Phycisphaerae bacterium]
MRGDLNRRAFIQGVGATGLVGALTTGVHSEAQSEKRPGPNGRPRIAQIGCGSIGRHNANIVLGLDRADYVAVCDPDANRAGEWVEWVGKRQKHKPEACGDFRKVLDRKDVDAVWVSTPDHWHALVTIHACMAGKDVFVEKPVSHNVIEGRRMVQAARKFDRIVQAGTQQRSGPHMKAGCEYVGKGELGKVGLCKAWVVDHRSPLDHPADGAPPKGVDYDLWLGPAPKRAFNPNRFHYQWRWFWDYAGGKCTDWGIHLIDMIHWAMGVDAPLSVSSAGARAMCDDNCETPDTQIAIFEYPGFTCTWEHREGNAFPPERLRHGIGFHGTKGTMLMDRNGWQVYSEQAGGKDLIPEAPKMKGSNEQMYVDHAAHWLDCLASRERPRSDIEIAHRTTTAVQLANIAYKVKRRIAWDREKEQIVGDAEASELLGRAYRNPWDLPRL